MRLFLVCSVTQPAVIVLLTCWRISKVLYGPAKRTLQRGIKMFILWKCIWTQWHRSSMLSLGVGARTAVKSSHFSKMVLRSPLSPPNTQSAFVPGTKHWYMFLWLKLLVEGSIWPCLHMNNLQKCCHFFQCRLWTKCKFAWIILLVKSAVIFMPGIRWSNWLLGAGRTNCS